MTVFGRVQQYFKPKVKSFEEQLVDLEQLPLDEIEALVLQDPNSAISIASIARLNYGTLLVKLALDREFVAAQREAKRRLAEMIDQGLIDLSKLSKDGMDLITQLSVVELCASDDLLKNLLNSSDDTDFLCQVSLEGLSIKSRRLAVEKIEDEETLKALLKAVKSRDKQIYRIVKAKCDGFRDRARQLAETHSKIIGIREGFESLCAKPFDKTFSARKKLLEEQWVLLAPDATDLESIRIQAALEKCQHTVEEFVRHQAEIEARKSAIANAGKLQAEVIGALREVLTGLFECVASDGEYSRVEALIEASRDKWINAAQYQKPKSFDQESYKELNIGIEFQLQQLRQHGSLIEQVSQVQVCLSKKLEGLEVSGADSSLEISFDSAFQNLRTRLRTARLVDSNSHGHLLAANTFISECEKEKEKRKKFESKQMGQLSALIRQARSAADSGQSRSATGIRRTIEEKRSKLESLPPKLTRHLEELDAVLEKIWDWKNYVVKPKKQELIDRMKALIGSEQGPEILATRITRLQAEWKGLGAVANDQSSWELFQQYSREAYEPCKSFFEKQGRLRSKNLENRIEIVTQLNDFCSKQKLEEIDEIDPKSVEKIIAASIKEWTKFSYVDRALNKPVQQGFDAGLRIIRERLNAQYKKNVEKKLKLIDGMAKLADYEDSSLAVNEAKRLQSEWKTVGPSQRSEEQRLWKEFRKKCDVVFEKRQQKNEEFKAELEANRNIFSALITETRSLSALSGKALLDARGRIQEIKKEQGALADLPRANSNTLSRDFNQAISGFDAKVASQLNADKEEVWISFLSAAEKIRSYQVAESEDAAIELEKEAKEFISNVERWPINGLEAIEKKMALGVGNETTEQNEKKLRELCIRGEILRERETPSEDKALRMQYQISRLEHGFGQKEKDNQSQINALIFEWVAVGPVSNHSYSPLFKRFKNCF